uniref:Phenylalanyl-tRNA synthetase domain-containing protein n=1 Tax=Parascaris equorum TaxID=6256 RepID=A0A914S5X1_PAREQ
MFSIDRVFRNETLDATHLAEFHQLSGITNLRFKPTYNPYTEPSMEIFAYHEGLKKWVEIGNSGIPTMIRYGIDNIRDLFGPKVNLEMIYQNPLCRLDKS